MHIRTAESLQGVCPCGPYARPEASSRGPSGLSHPEPQFRFLRTPDPSLAALNIPVAVDRAVKQSCDDPRRPAHLAQNHTYLFPGQYNRQSFRPSRMHRHLEIEIINFHDIPVEEKNCRQRLILSRSANMPFDRKMRQKSLHFRHACLSWMPLLIK